MTSTAAKQIIREYSMLRVLRSLDLFCGVTDDSVRRERIRARIVALGLEDASAGRIEGEPVTWRALFERHFGEPL